MLKLIEEYAINVLGFEDEANRLSGEYAKYGMIPERGDLMGCI